jgi:hypothetical protein
MHRNVTTPKYQISHKHIDGNIEASNYVFSCEISPSNRRDLACIYVQKYRYQSNYQLRNQSHSNRLDLEPLERALLKLWSILVYSSCQRAHDTLPRNIDYRPVSSVQTFSLSSHSLHIVLTCLLITYSAVEHRQRGQEFYVFFVFSRRISTI